MDDGDDVTNLANALLGKEEEIKPDDKPVDEAPAEGDKPAEDDKTEEVDKDKPEDKPSDDKPAEGDKPEDKPADDANKPTDDKPSDDAKEDRPLTKEEIREVLREEAEERAAVTSERASFAGKVRSDLREALKLDSTYTTPTLDDGTPITSVTQLTQVINPETDEPYTREEAATLLLDARKIVDDNVAANEAQIDKLTDLNVDFKEQADEVDRLYGEVLKAFPEEAKGWLAAYQKTFKMSEDGSYVTDVPISPLEFYGPIVKPFLNASAQVAQQQAEAAAAEAKAVREAEIKAEQEDRGDLGGTAGAAQGKPNLLADALTAYGKDN